MHSLWWMAALGCTLGTYTPTSLEQAAQPPDDGDGSGDGSGEDSGVAGEHDVEADEPLDSLAAEPACETIGGQSVPGATTYYVGDFTISDEGRVGGVEWRVVRVNAAWAADGGVDCALRWTVSGTLGAPGEGCPSCDVRLDIDATIDAAGTDCPTFLLNQWGDQATFSVAYDVDADIDGDGPATFYLPSGAELGVGTASDGRVRYISPFRCEYL